MCEYESEESESDARGSSESESGDKTHFGAIFCLFEENSVIVPVLVTYISDTVPISILLKRIKSKYLALFPPNQNC